MDDKKLEIKLKCLEFANHQAKDTQEIIARAKAFESYIYNLDNLLSKPTPPKKK